MSKVPTGYTGHARDLLKGSVIKDPGIKITDDVKILMTRDGVFVIFDARLPLATNAGEFETSSAAEAAARAKYGHEIKPKTGPAKQSAADEEAFAAMKRAMANGFAKHEPAYDDKEGCS